MQLNLVKMLTEVLQMCIFITQTEREENDSEGLASEHMHCKIMCIFRHRTVNRIKHFSV